jgi:DNA-binding phage protein
MQVVQFEQARRFKVAREKAGIEEYNFKNVYEFVEFVASEIRKARIPYVKLAKKAKCHPRTIAKIADRETMAPRITTCLPILKALGFEIFVRG